METMTCSEVHKVPYPSKCRSSGISAIEQAPRTALVTAYSSGERGVFANERRGIPLLFAKAWMAMARCFVLVVALTINTPPASGRCILIRAQASLRMYLGQGNQRKQRELRRKSKERLSYERDKHSGMRRTTAADASFTKNLYSPLVRGLEDYPAGIGMLTSVKANPDRLNRLHGLQNGMIARVQHRF